MTSTGTETLQTFWGCTDLKLRRLHYVWTIRNFSFCPQNTGEEMNSPNFGPIEGPQWYLSLYPRGDVEANKNHISLYLCLALHSKGQEEKKQCTVKYKFILLNSELVPIYDSKPESIPKNLDIFENGLGYEKLIIRDHMLELLKGDLLNVCCEITIFRGGVTNTSGQSDDSPVPECTLSGDLELTFKEQKFGDTIIEVADKKFLVYKGILQSRSPVFAAMFQYELEEKKQNRVMITDAEPKVIEEMLTYIYTGRSPNIETMAIDLLPISEKYNLKRLKIMSENAMAKNLTRENAVDTLISADLYRANLLKRKVINLIIAESSYFLKDAIWKNLQSSLSKSPDLMMELMKALFMSKK